MLVQFLLENVNVYSAQMRTKNIVNSVINFLSLKNNKRTDTVARSLLEQ